MAVFHGGPHHGIQVPMHSLDLAVALGVVGGGVCDLDAEGFSDFLHQVADELLTAVGVDGLRNAVAGKDFFLQRPDGSGGCRLGHGERLDPF